MTLIESTNTHLLRMIEQRRKQIEKLQHDIDCLQNLQTQKIWKWNIDELGFSTRTRNALHRAGIDIVDQLISMFSSNVDPQIPNIGAAALEEIDSVMLSLMPELQ